METEWDETPDWPPPQPDLIRSRLVVGPTDPAPRPRSPRSAPTEPVEPPDASFERSPTIGLSLLVGVGLALLVGAVAFGAVRVLGGSDDVDQSTAPPAPGDPGATSDSSTVPLDGQSEGERSEATVAAPAAAVPAPDPPFVRATLVGPELTLAGTVPSDEVAVQLAQAAEMVYAPFTATDVTVDEQLPSQDWLAGAPQAIGLLQLINAGTMTIADGRIHLTGRAASDADVAELEQALVASTGLPVEIGEIEITDLRPAVYVIAATDGQVALSGALPTEELRTGLVAAAAAVYGDENVFDASTTDATVEDALWMYNPSALMGVLAAFPDYEIRLDGGAFSAALSGGSTFPSDSSEFTPEFAQVLNFGVVVMARDPAMTMRIEGHTDSSGDAGYNLSLSQARADAVASYVTAAGIAPERVTAIGMGEDAPVASNETAEGRARNRRIEFELLTPQ